MDFNRDPPMTNEALSPPTDADRARRDMEYVRRVQAAYAAGFRARQQVTPPPLPKGQRGANKTSMADVVDDLCPKDPPAHERTSWRSGFMDADGIATAKGHAYLGTKNCERPPRKAKDAAVAEPVEAFPEFVLETRTPLGRNERGLLSPGGMAPAKKYGTPDDQP